MSGFEMFLGFITGLAFFLYGMKVLGDGLEKMSGGKLESILEKLTSTPLRGILLGAGVTAIIQSSSATTVMVVGFVNSGIMRLEQGIGIIIGANLGTCITSWILSLSQISGTGFFIQLLKPAVFSPFLAVIGVVLLLFCKKEKKVNIGIILTGFSVLMIGMEWMSDSMSGLRDVPAFTGLMVKFSKPILGLLVGLVLTAIIQSSSASIGILQALAMTGIVSYATAIPIVIGQNIGTCATALLSSFGAKVNAKRAAMVHLLYNVISAVICMIAFYSINAFVHFGFMGTMASSVGVAVVHTVFNLFKLAILGPFSKQLGQLSCLIYRDKTEQEIETKEEYAVAELDVRFLEKPALAMEHCRNVAVRMANLSKDTLLNSISLVSEFDKSLYDKVVANEELVDMYEDKLGTYLLKLSSKELSEQDSIKLSLFLHLIGDYERISDHALNIAQSAKEMNKKELFFSKKASAEIGVFADLLIEIIDTAVKAFEYNDVDLAANVEPMEEVADKLNKEIKKRHVKRLRKGKCTIELGFVLSDITTSFERIADHCSNIAVGVIQTREDGYESHEYLDTLDKGENTEFREKYLTYKERYVLP